MVRTVPKKWFWKSIDNALMSAESVETNLLALGLAQNLRIPFKKDAIEIARHLQKASKLYVEIKMRGYVA